jgi:hypothetical protein
MEIVMRGSDAEHFSSWLRGCAPASAPPASASFILIHTNRRVSKLILDAASSC